MNSRFSDIDLHLFNEGRFYENYAKLGAHPGESEGRRGVWFAVWAPNAEAVSVIGDFNSWKREAHPLRCLASSGIWEGFVPGLEPGALYKYFIRSRERGYSVEKADPFAFAGELRPRTASRVCDLETYRWGDDRWMKSRGGRNNLEAPLSIYEVHLGSWMRVPEEDGRLLTYREAAALLAVYARKMAFTHVELLPVTEHPFDGSWGYQTLGYFAATSRFGAPDDFMFLVDTLHQEGIGVILDWAPAHFPNDEHGLAFFDGTHLYEHADPRQKTHPHWDSLIFNYGRAEVANFLIGSALFWFDKYHVDGLRIDAVASMLYLDYGRKEGGWVANRHGGKENIEAVDFLQRLNTQIYARFPEAMTLAEESTSWPGVSRPVSNGGLGFGFKWNMGWMHDVLRYMSADPKQRPERHDSLTFGMLYAYHENFVLPFSHDEVVHGKGSMLGKMPGDDWRKFANLRLLYAFMFGHPGKKLLFMGCEFGQRGEWNHDVSLDWHLVDHAAHLGLQKLTSDLNRLYRSEPALFLLDCEPGGFEWIDCSDRSGVVCFVRESSIGDPPIVVVCNFMPELRYDYRIGAPRAGRWEEVLNTDAAVYGGSGVGNLGGMEAEPVGCHGHAQSLRLILPPLGALFLKAADRPPSLSKVNLQRLANFPCPERPRSRTAAIASS